MYQYPIKTISHIQNEEGEFVERKKSRKQLQMEEEMKEDGNLTNHHQPSYDIHEEISHLK